jgi:hypothetical protein
MGKKKRVGCISCSNNINQFKPDHPEYDTVQKSFSQKIESALKFYRELNNKVKSTFHVNTQTFGIGW